MTVAVIGMGLMGRPLLRRLRACGVDAIGWNRSPLAAELRADLPLSDDLAGLLAQADTILLLLSDSAAVTDFLARALPSLPAGRLIIDMGSSDPRETRRLAGELAVRQIALVDAPVSGGPEGAAAGSLALMVGGTAADVARAQPLLAHCGRVTHVGAVGAGHLVKVINQLIVGLTIAAVAEATVLAEDYGIAPAQLRSALSGGFADSRILQLHGARMEARRYTPGGKVTTQLKDLRLAAELCADHGVTLPHLALALEQYQQLVAAGHGALDHSALHLLLDQRGDT
jgi:2-hydroxy-3-oxopropionate reductase